MLYSTEELRERARMAALAKHHPNRPDLLVDGQRALKAGALERRIRDATSIEPVLTLAQRVRLAAALLDAPGGDAA